MSKLPCAITQDNSLVCVVVLYLVQRAAGTKCAQLCLVSWLQAGWG